MNCSIKLIGITSNPLSVQVHDYFSIPVSPILVQEFFLTL